MPIDSNPRKEFAMNGKNDKELKNVDRRSVLKTGGN